MSIWNVTRSVRLALGIICLLGGMAQSEEFAFKQQLVPFQGRLYDQSNTAVTDGLHKLTFSIYLEASTGVPIWEEEHDNVSVINGYVSVILGAKEPLVYQEDVGNIEKDSPINFTKSDFYVAVAIDGGAPLFPRQQLIPSFHSRTADKAKYLTGVVDTDILYSADDIKQFETAHAEEISKLKTFEADYFITENLGTENERKVARYADKIDGVSLEQIVNVYPQLNEDGTPKKDEDGNELNYWNAKGADTLGGQNPDHYLNVDEHRGFLVPVGTIMMWPKETPPPGWLECNGASLSAAEGSIYKPLFDVVGGMYGSTTNEFNLPDLRGRFVRGWDNGEGRDPDADYRTDRGDGVTGDEVGTLQADEIIRHTHELQLGLSEDEDGMERSPKGVKGDNEGLAPITMNADNFAKEKGGNETRPKNISMMFIIKY